MSPRLSIPITQNHNCNMEVFSYSPLASFYICFLLRHHWPIIVYEFHMYNTIFLRLYTLQQAHNPKVCFHLSPYSWYHLLISPFPYSFPFGNQHSVLYIYFFLGGVACAFLLLFGYFFYTPHMSEIIWDLSLNYLT